MNLTDEQHAFVEAIRDFAKRECGTREQRDALTENGREPHNPRSVRADRRARVARGRDPRGVRRHRRRLGRPVPAVRGVLARPDPDGLLPGDDDVGASGRAVRDRRAEGGDPRRGSSRGTVYAIAMSEPEAGSDVGNLSCRAERSNGGYVINGQKTWITGAHAADHILLVCRTSRTEDKHYGLTMISVPRDG